MRKARPGEHLAGQGTAGQSGWLVVILMRTAAVGVFTALCTRQTAIRVLVLTVTMPPWLALAGTAAVSQPAGGCRSGAVERATATLDPAAQPFGI